MRCYRHRLGADRGTDELLLAVQDAKEWCSVYEPDEGDVTVFETGDFWSNTVRIRPLGAATEPRTIWTSSKHRAQVNVPQGPVLRAHERGRAELEADDG